MFISGIEFVTRPNPRVKIDMTWHHWRNCWSVCNPLLKSTPPDVDGVHGGRLNPHRFRLGVSHPQVFWELEFHLILITISSRWSNHPEWQPQWEKQPSCFTSPSPQDHTRKQSPRSTSVYHSDPIHHVSTESSEVRIPECTDKLWYFLFNFWKYIHRCIVVDGTDT